MPCYSINFHIKVKEESLKNLAGDTYEFFLNYSSINVTEGSERSKAEDTTVEMK
jgi:hypothetical protein